MENYKNNDCAIHLDRNNRELQHHGTTEFPCVSYTASFSNENGDDIPWHWHDEMELIVVMDGCMKLDTPFHQYVLNCGEGIFINSGVLHYAVAAPACTIYSIVFHPNLIYGNTRDVFYTKYIAPLTNDEQVDSVFISAVDGRSNYFSAADLQQLHSSFSKAYESLTYLQNGVSLQDGVEFVIREKLSHICISMWSVYKNCFLQNAKTSSIHSMRSKIMMEYIHTNYAKALTLADIASSANISIRECLRCFQQTIKISPIQYLLKYRLTQATSLLQADYSKNITEIAFQCGFNNASYFTKTFILHFGMSPREYRKSKDHTQNNDERKYEGRPHLRKSI